MNQHHPSAFVQLLWLGVTFAGLAAVGVSTALRKRQAEMKRVPIPVAHRASSR